MKRSRWTALISLLSVAALALAALNLGFSGPRTAQTAVEGVDPTAKTTTSQDGAKTAESAGKDNAASAGSAVTLSPLRVAATFGWVKAVVAPPPPPQAPEPTAEEAGPQVIDAPWLSLVGTISRPDSTTLYYFKNGRTGAIMELTTDMPIAGWTLSVPEAGVYIIENATEHYRVGKSQ